MRIRAIEVRNWACIESLSLAELGDGINVLHGPNTTGKTSLAEAIRCCLFDLDHNSTSKKLADAIPRRTKHTPQVTVELDVGAQRFRVCKAFSKNKDGHAKVEQLGPSGWITIEEGKEANRRIREIIGVEKSTSGLFQLLWLQQGEIRLPEKLDPLLSKALESILGSMITGRDLDFKKRLDKACERWFTPTMQEKKGSPATKLDVGWKEADGKLKEIYRQWDDAESALRQYDEALTRQPELKRHLDEAQTELDRVQRECEGVRQRKSRHDLAVQNRLQCERLLEQAGKTLNELDDAARQLETANTLSDNLQLELRSAGEKRAQAEHAATSACQAAEHADLKLIQHQENRATLEDRQRLITNQLQQEAIEVKIRQVEDLAKKREELEQKLVGPAVMTESQITELRRNRDKAVGLRGRLEAGEIHVSIQAKQPLEARIAGDGAAAETVEISESQERRLLIRQRAEIQIGALAVVRVGRGKEDRDLEDLARELAQLERWLRDTLTAVQLDPDDSAAIDQLAARRVHHEEYTKQLHTLRGQIAQTAPNGLPSLHAEFQQKRDEQEAVFTRQPELRTWTPDAIQTDRLRFEFDDRETKLRSAALEAKRGAERSSESLRKAAEAEQSIRTRIAAQAVQFQSLKEQVGRSDRAALSRECEEAKAQLADAVRKAEESTLTEAEQAMESHHQNLRNAHANRAKRTRDNEDLLLRLQTQLAGTEGLHQKRIQAEQAVHDLTRELTRERLYADAHKHLKELFEQVRQEQVRRTVGPINDRVMHWAKQLGLTDYSGLFFGDQLLPGGLVPTHAANDEPVEMDCESYGTLEQLSLLIRLAIGGLLSQSDSAVAILDDPLAHADPGKHRKMLEILDRAARGDPHGPHPTGPLQLIILTCHEDRFDYLDGAQQIDLARLIRRGA